MYMPPTIRILLLILLSLFIFALGACAEGEVVAPPTQAIALSPVETPGEPKSDQFFPSVDHAVSPLDPSEWEGTPMYVPHVGVDKEMPTPEPTTTPTPTSTPTPTTTPTPTATYTPSPTPEPTPTPTPTIPWPPPLDAPGQSKLGIHVNWNTSPEIMDFIRHVKPAVVKAAGDLGFMNEVKQVSPETVTVARLAEGDQNVHGDPRERARHFVAKNLDTYQTYPGVDYWEGWNEPVVGDQMAWYAEFEAERVRVMAQHGLRTAVGAFSTGVPEWRDFADFMPAIKAAHRHGGIFTVHEYDAPRMDRLVGVAIPDRPARADRGALTLRYRWWYEDYILPRGFNVPLVISEAGIDGGVIGEPRKGWRDYAPHRTPHGPDQRSIQDYIEQLAWYDSEVRKDDYVIGFAVFSAGMIGERWVSFDITNILRHLAVYVAGQR